MLTLALVLSIVGCAGMIGVIGFGIYLAFRKPKLEEPLPDGIYHLHVKGRNRLTGAALYDLERVNGEEK